MNTVKAQTVINRDFSHLIFFLKLRVDLTWLDGPYLPAEAGTRSNHRLFDITQRFMAIVIPKHAFQFINSKWSILLGL